MYGGRGQGRLEWVASHSRFEEAKQKKFKIFARILWQI